MPLWGKAPPDFLVWMDRLEERKMPRPKTINSNDIKLKKINAEVIGGKNCLGVKLHFNTAFTPEQAEVLKNFYKFQVSNDGHTVTRSIRNSWKGLVMMLISISYCRYRNKVVAQWWNCANRKKIKATWRIRIDFNYESFLSDETLSKLQREALAAMPNVDVKAYFLDREAHKKRKQEQEQKFKDLLMNRKEDSSFENVPAPDGWKALYVSYRCTDEDIETHLKIFTNLLDIDREKSIITTEFADEIPHSYTIYPAVYKR